MVVFHCLSIQIRLFKQFGATIVIFTMDVLSHMLRFSVAMVLFMCLFSNPHCTGYNYVKFIALSGRSLLLTLLCGRMGWGDGYYVYET